LGRDRDHGRRGAARGSQGADARGVPEPLHHVAGIGSDLGRRLAMTTYHVGLQSQIQAFVEIRNEFVREPYPAWTGVGVTELYAGAVVEISLVAELPRSD